MKLHITVCFRPQNMLLIFLEGGIESHCCIRKFSHTQIHIEQSIYENNLPQIILYFFWYRCELFNETMKIKKQEGPHNNNAS